MEKLFLLIGLFCCLGSARGDGKGDASAARLFAIRYGEELSLEELRQRIRYGEMLQPQVEGDSVVLPMRKKSCPKRYAEYAQRFADMLNRHLKEMPCALKLRVLQMVEKNSVRLNMVIACVRREGHRNYMGLSEKEAQRLGVEEERRRVIELFRLPSVIPGEVDEDDVSTSIFLNISFLGDNEPAVKALKEDFDRLNASFME